MKQLELLTADNKPCVIVERIPRALETSAMARDSQSTETRGKYRKLILGAIQAHCAPISDEVIVEWCKRITDGLATPSGVRTQRCYLERDGLIEATAKGPTSTGRTCRRFSLTERGESVLREIK